MLASSHLMCAVTELLLGTGMILTVLPSLLVADASNYYCCTNLNLVKTHCCSPPCITSLYGHPASGSPREEPLPFIDSPEVEI